MSQKLVKELVDHNTTIINHQQVENVHQSRCDALSRPQMLSWVCILHYCIVIYSHLLALTKVANDDDGELLASESAGTMQAGSRWVVHGRHQALIHKLGCLQHWPSTPD